MQMWTLSMATVAPVDNAHCSGATPSKSRVAIPFGHPMWPAHVARICSGVRIMLALLSVGRTTGQRGQWPLSMATVAPTGHFLLGRGLLGRLGTLLRLATRTGSVGHGSVGHQNLKSRRALGVGSARAPGERWKVSAVPLRGCTLARLRDGVAGRGRATRAHATPRRPERSGEDAALGTQGRETLSENSVYRSWSL